MTDCVLASCVHMVESQTLPRPQKYLVEATLFIMDVLPISRDQELMHVVLQFVILILKFIHV